MNILVLNGPNLNMLGLREEDIYGSDSLKDIENRLAIIAERNNCKIDFYQSNAEHELIDVIQNSLNKKDHNYIFAKLILAEKNKIEKDYRTELNSLLEAHKNFYEIIDTNLK